MYSSWENSENQRNRSIILKTKEIPKMDQKRHHYGHLGHYHTTWYLKSIVMIRSLPHLEGDGVDDHHDNEMQITCVYPQIMTNNDQSVDIGNVSELQKWRKSGTLIFRK